jgi:hypothetical protein
MTHHIYNLNELTILPFMVRCLFGLNTSVLAVEPWLPTFRAPIHGLASWAFRTGRAHDLINIFPELVGVREAYSQIHLYNIFGKIEDWQNQRFRFNEVEKIIPAYALAYKNITTKDLSLRYLSIILLDKAFTKYKDCDIKIFGLLASTIEAYTAYTGKQPPASLQAISPTFFPFINLALTLCSVVYSFAWVAIRIRPFKIKVQKAILAGDYFADPRDNQLYDLAATAGPVILFTRTRTGSDKEIKLFSRYRPYKTTDGRFLTRTALETFNFLLRDVAVLFANFNELEPRHFFQIIALPYRRAVLRGLFEKFKPEYFWGRDDYNVEHILRHQELQRIGKRSIGINHGFATYCDITPSFRYISFDQYFVFGKICRNTYKATWAKSMEVIPVGTFGAKPDDYKMISINRPKDLLILSGVFTREPKLVKFVRGLAAAFPERTIWLQLKLNYRSLKCGKDFISQCTQDRKNIKYTSEPILELFRRATYAFSDPSTVVLEAIQFGLDSFMIDICDRHEVCQLRNFDGLCVSSAEEAIERIKSLELGKTAPARGAYGDLINLSGRPFIDIIADSIDLPVKRPQLNVIDEL